MEHDQLVEAQGQEQQQEYLNHHQSPVFDDTEEEEESTPITSTTTSLDTDKPMIDVEPPAPLWSVIDDGKQNKCCPREREFFVINEELNACILSIVEQIINKEMIPFDEEIIETKVDHWVIKNWKELETRQEGPIIKAGGHDW